MTTEKQLKHRFAMIVDDLIALREFIAEHGLSQSFYSKSKYADCGWTHLNNIEIACDLHDDESLSWDLYGSSCHDEGRNSHFNL